MTKDDLRKLYRKKRQQLSVGVCQRMDRQILSYLISMEWSDCRYLHVYLPIGKFNEPNTSLFVQWIKESHPYVRLVLSRSDMPSGTMVNYLWDEHTDLVMNRWEVMEPISGEVIEEDKIDVVLVPLLVADVNGNRVGYGKGFYDRFLSRCRPDVQTIGLGYFELVDPIDDVGIWDIPLKYYINPQRITDFR